MARTPHILTVPRWLPRLGATLGFFVFLAANMLLFMGRKVEVLRPEWLLALAPDVYSHVSNLVIASLLHGAIGYLWLLLGVQRHGLMPNPAFVPKA